MCKQRANDRGFKLQLPYGAKSTNIYFSCTHYRATRIGCNENELTEHDYEGKPVLRTKKCKACPFSLIFKKHQLALEGQKEAHPLA
jgi:hypothetical protein